MANKTRTKPYRGFEEGPMIRVGFTEKEQWDISRCPSHKRDVPTYLTVNGPHVEIKCSLTGCHIDFIVKIPEVMAYIARAEARKLKRNALPQTD